MMWPFVGSPIQCLQRTHQRQYHSGYNHYRCLFVKPLHSSIGQSQSWCAAGKVDESMTSDSKRLRSTRCYWLCSLLISHQNKLPELDVAHTGSFPSGALHWRINSHRPGRCMIVPNSTRKWLYQKSDRFLILTPGIASGNNDRARVRPQHDRGSQIIPGTV